MSNPLSVKATLFRQHGKQLASFILPSSVLRRICYVLPRSSENPTEIQRHFTPKRLREIGAYLMRPESLLPSSIVLNLLEMVTIQPGVHNEATIIFPTDGTENEGVTLYTPDHKYAYILDGQHRILGFDYAPGVEYELQVTALIHEDPALCAKVFADINSKQAKVGNVLLEAIRLQIGDLTKEETEAAKLVRRLNETKSSPFRNLINYPESTSKAPISSVTLRNTIQPMVSNGGVLYEMTTEVQRINALIEYYTAWQKTFPDAWGSDSHVLTKNIGLYVMARMARRLFDNVSRYHGGHFICSKFETSLEPIRKVTWKGSKLSGPWGLYSNKAGMDKIVQAILDVIRENQKVPANFEKLASLAGDEDVEP